MYTFLVYGAFKVERNSDGLCRAMFFAVASLREFSRCELHECMNVSAFVVWIWGCIWNCRSASRGHGDRVALLSSRLSVSVAPCMVGGLAVVVDRLDLASPGEDIFFSFLSLCSRTHTEY